MAQFLIGLGAIVSVVAFINWIALQDGIQGAMHQIYSANIALALLLGFVIMGVGCCLWMLVEIRKAADRIADGVNPSADK